MRMTSDLLLDFGVLFDPLDRHHHGLDLGSGVYDGRDEEGRLDGERHGEAHVPAADGVTVHDGEQRREEDHTRRQHVKQHTLPPTEGQAH